MTWQTAHAKDKQQLGTIVVAIEDMLVNGPVQVQIRNKEESRRDAQNRLQHHWFKECHAQNNQLSVNEYRAFCKYHFGIPILCRDEQCKEQLARVFKHLQYEQRLELMQEPFDMPVTRLFSVKEFAEYLNQIEQYFTKNGYRLTTGDDLYWQAVMRDAA